MGAMLDRLSQRLLTLLQLTRMALVFTAISNSLCALLLATRQRTPEDEEVFAHLDWHQVVAVVLISIGLYGFGMSLNDIIDRRRDRQLAAHRPLPSGRIRVLTAHLVCVLLMGMALVAGGFYASHSEAGWRSFALVVGTGLLIAFYDFAGKYLVWVGLLTLGFIRFFHATIAAPQVPVLWHPLLLFTHVALLSTVCYAWEEKRPALTRLHWVSVIGGVVGVDALALAMGLARQEQEVAGPGVALHWGLLGPAALAGGFVFVAWRIKRLSPNLRQAGQTLMLAGLLWLIVYDSAFAWAYVGGAYALGLLLLLPLSYLMVLLMRWWARLVVLSQPPEFMRVRSQQEIHK